MYVKQTEFLNPKITQIYLLQMHKWKLVYPLIPFSSGNKRFEISRFYGDSEVQRTQHALH